jgi:5'-nucleotidase
MWAQINSHPSYFRDMPIFEGAAAFFKKIEWLDPIILTACPNSNYAHAARQKRAWVREHLSTSCMILPVMGGRHKPLFMHAPGDVLIDDFPKNIEAWRDEGGVGILHKGDFDETHDALIDVLDKRGLLP